MSSAHQQRIVAAAVSLEATTAAFLAFLERLPETTAIQPLPGRWTPAGHASHLALTNDVFLGVIRGGEGCTGPIAAFQGTSDFSDETWDMDAPPSPVVAPSILIPPSDISRSAAAAQLRESVAKLRPAIETLDSTIATLCVRLPWNVVSLYQMCEWAGGHTVRHLSQVNRDLQIAAMLGTPAAS